MNNKPNISAVWSDPSINMEAWGMSLGQSLPSGVVVFFRADDIGVPDDNCHRMIETFREYFAPLCLAVVPSWLDEKSWKTLRGWTGDWDLWCWHQHGWAHENHQKDGKSCEFGSDRPLADKIADIKAGRDKLSAIMGDDFQPFFTPPWNRIDPETGQALADLGYIAVSRSSGENEKIPTPPSLPDLSVNVDLHTRREIDPVQARYALEQDFVNASETGRVGIMLHHQLMNETAFRFLAGLLLGVTSGSCRTVHLGDLL
ncbi:polysaccharide deacetylase family protein [Pseudodesulfovibrio tunisiensis]|uniref:polysaccharide deacetylase family protein n=1 Tax=Pseudodesulfovibrio tunisiensis TaxID=463192 RepID=UPI001FB33243|nr:polysaccharide deacetylase family protein [Pseudodesulfovibrio tunisiensis]